MQSISGTPDDKIYCERRENAGNVFKAAEIKIYKSQVEDARENIELLKEEKLSELTKFHAGFHGIQ